MLCTKENTKENNRQVGVQRLHLSMLETNASVRFKGFYDTAQADRMMCGVVERCEEDDLIKSVVIWSKMK